jgi:antitoxin HigA-1
MKATTMSMSAPVHPGEIIREDVLAALDLTVVDAAARLGVSRVALSRVLNCRASVSPSLAVRLETSGVGTARAWLAMQSAHDLARERLRDHGVVRQLADAV